MASSGYASFTIYRDGMIRSVLRLLRVIQDGQLPSYNDNVNVSEAMNMLLKNWQVRGQVLALYQQIAVPLVQGQTSYTIGPVDADITIQRPIQVWDGSFVQDGDGVDRPLRIISRQEYDQITSKNTQGIVDAVYWRPAIDIEPAPPLYQASPSIGYGTLYLYLPADNNDQAIYINTRRAVQDMINGGDEFDLPQEWFQPIRWGTAAQVADEYEVPEDRCKRIAATAEEYFQEMVEWNRNLYDINYGERRQQINRTLASEKA